MDVLGARFFRIAFAILLWMGAGHCFNAQADCSPIPSSVGAHDPLIFLLPGGGETVGFKKRESKTASPIGTLLFDSDINRLRFCNGSSWVTLQMSPSEAVPSQLDYQSDVSWGNDWRTAKSGPTSVGGNSDTWWRTTRWKQVSTGTHHTCAIRDSDSRIFCWGQNNRGQLGDGTTENRSVPTALTSTGGFDAMAWSYVGVSHEEHTCALRQSDSRIFCWGRNGSGQLGRGFQSSEEPAPAALSSTGGWDTTAWTKLAVGRWHNCAIRSSDSRLFCWGLNATGQIGDETEDSRSVPTALTTTEDWNTTEWSDIALGYTSCGIRSSDSRLFCWGNNSFGALGVGSSGGTNRRYPRPLSSSGGWDTMAWSQVSVGRFHACAIRSSDSRLFCWGRNDTGQVGDDSFEEERPSPTALTATDNWNTTEWSSVTAGEYTTCAIRSSDSQLFCWGSNAAGGVGDGTETNRSRPTALAGGFDSVSWHQASVDKHTCALRASDKRLFCWGLNNFGQLGDGLTSNRNVPAELTNRVSSATTNWSQVFAGTEHLCAIRSSDAVVNCWGANSAGQLGTGFTQGQNLPGPLLEEEGWSTTAWSQFGLGEFHTCGIRSDDSRIFCWGRGNDGRLGRGSNSNSNSPVALASAGGFDAMAWSQVVSGDMHSCAIRTSDSQIFCWGNNNNGRLGDGTLESRNVPTALSSDGGWSTTAWSAVAAGSRHTCAIRSSDSRIFCWGANNNGALGDGTQENRLVPTALSAAGGWNSTAWSAVSAGIDFTCAIRTSDSGVFCWGNGGSGRLGSGSNDDQLVPGPLTASDGWNAVAWNQISAGGTHTCARRSSDSRLFCWGSNVSGQLGDGTTSNSNIPRSLTTENDFATTAWSNFVAGFATSCAVRTADSKLFCWGSDGNGRLGIGGNLNSTSVPVEVAATGGFEVIPWHQVSGGESHFCGIRADNFQLNCWGDGGNNRLGIGPGTGLNRFSPVPLAGGFDSTQWYQVSAGGSYTCAIRRSDFQIFCWGGNSGNLGDGTSTARNVPVPLAETDGWSTTAWKKVVALNHTCAIRAKDSRLFCWGVNTNGRLGTGDTATYLIPTALHSNFANTAWKDVSLGPLHSCAIRALDGVIFCWGNGNTGRLGSAGGETSIPRQMDGGFETTSWDSLAVGSGHACAIRSSDRAIYCWGLGTSGQLGDGTNSFGRSTPAPLAGAFATTAWKWVTAQLNTTCAIRASDEKIFCWGLNNQGQLGDGTFESRNTPTAVTGDAANFSFDMVTLSNQGAVAIPKSSGQTVSCNGTELPFRSFPTNLALEMKSSSDQFFISRLFQNPIKSGTLTFNDREMSLAICVNGLWQNLTATIGGSCESYPAGGASDGVLSFFNTGKMGVLTRTSAGPPRLGSLIYNTSSNQLQYCDGQNWWELQSE